MIRPFACMFFSLVTLALTALSLGARAESLPFDTAVAEIDAAPQERFLDGTVEAVNQATMSAQTSGRIAEVFYDVDDYVEPGDAIVRFTDVEQQSSLRQAEAALAEAVARQRQADEDFQRVSGLLESGSATGYIYTADDERILEFDFAQEPWELIWTIRGLDGTTAGRIHAGACAVCRHRDRAACRGR